tara:strand:- start:622 stop:930 length:309 start_codon:yes stop_codon:yes gene_type:complete
LIAANGSSYSLLIRLGCSLGTVGGAGLVEDASDVVTDGPEANEQLGGNLSVSAAAADQQQYFHFTLNWAARVSGPRDEQERDFPGKDLRVKLVWKPLSRVVN